MVDEETNANDPMSLYLKKEDEIVQWMENNPGEKWIDNDFPCNSSQFYEDAANIP